MKCQICGHIQSTAMTDESARLACHLFETLPVGVWLSLWNISGGLDIRSRITIARNKPHQYRAWGYETVRRAMRHLVDLGVAERADQKNKGLWRILPPGDRK